MRKVRLPKVEPDQYDWPAVCPHEGCDGYHFKPHGVQGERKAILDPRYAEVRAYRYRCLKCWRSFRAYPRGVSSDQQSDRLRAISVLLYALGLSYGAVEDLLEALGVAAALRERLRPLARQRCMRMSKKPGWRRDSGRARRWPKAKYVW